MNKLAGISTVAAFLCLGVSVASLAQDEAPSTTTSRLVDGTYIAPMATGVFPNDDTDFDDGYGGTLGLGYRSGFYAIEIAPTYFDLKDATGYGATVNGLLFPFSSSGLYLTAGAGGLEYSDVETPTDQVDFAAWHVDGGLGYLFPIASGRYDWAIRAEARYRYGEREKDFNDADVDFDIAREFEQVIVNIGLHLPLGLRPEPPPAPPAPPPAAVCSDTQDNDGDGLVDHPADPGCTSPDDSDEADPPQCSDGKDNDGDELVDFPADKGCTGADDNDETNPCKTPAPGERVSLMGCGTGDVIVLRGVNFEFDKSRLTADAKTILDNVAEELTAYPDIKVELGGHTDFKGTDEYNQKLSERRAASVKNYLVGKGIADSRLSTAGYGESQPIADNETDDGRALNRRVELKITGGVAASAPAAAPAADATVAPAADTPTTEAPTADAPAADAPPPESGSAE